MRNTPSPTPVNLAMMDRSQHSGWSSEEASGWGPHYAKGTPSKETHRRVRRRVLSNSSGISRANARAEAAEKKAQAAIEEVHRMTRILEKLSRQQEFSLAAQRARLEAVVGPLDADGSSLSEDVPFSEEFFRTFMSTDNE